MATTTLIERLAAAPPAARTAMLAALSDHEAAALAYDWTGAWARESQKPPPGTWRIWLVQAGRGFGKSRTGAEWVRERVARGIARRIALVGETAADVRDVMVEGPSGLLSIAPPWDRPIYEPSKRRLTWANGAIAMTFSADDPEQLRGPEFDTAWADEIAKWRRPETWDNLLFGLRIGVDPRVVATTTPKPVPLVKMLVRDPACVVTRGATEENRRNLAPEFLGAVVRKYQGTRLGRQELGGELLEDTPGALWSLGAIEQLRVAAVPVELVRVVVALDPAVTSDEDSDETGLIVAGRGADDHGYVLEDRSLRASPAGWAQEAVRAYREHQADRIVAEVNNGGDMVEHTLRTVDARIPYTKLHASRGKQTRAEPIAALYEQGRVHHVGTFPQLEDQMTGWVPGLASPDRMDALVWALTELLGDEEIRVLGGTARPPSADEVEMIERERAESARQAVLEAVRTRGMFWPGEAA